MVGSDMSRRRFGQGATAAAVVVGTGVVTGFAPASGTARPAGFGVRHDGSVKVMVGDGERFTVEIVATDTGEVLQRETDLDAKSVLRIRSDYADFFRVRPPGT